MRIFNNFQILLFLSGWLIWTSGTALADKTDVIILKNNDRITGEVKRMDYARLSFSTDGMKTLEIDWNEIKAIKAAEKFRVETDSNLDLLGTLDADTASQTLIVFFDTLRVSVPFSKVVRIIPIKESLWDQFKISMDLGFNFSKASNVGQLSFNGNASQRTWRTLRELQIISNVTAQKDTSASQYHDLSFSWKRFFYKRWFLAGNLGLQQNTELGVALRFLFGVSGGRDIIRTNTNILVSTAGLQATREWAMDDKTFSHHIEGVL
ncbi:MAG: DUF481 domain-containing protein, partial [Calditrichales bacterium]